MTTVKYFSGPSLISEAHELLHLDSGIVNNLMHDYCTAATPAGALKRCRPTLTRVIATCRMKDKINSLNIYQFKNCT